MTTRSEWCGKRKYWSELEAKIVLSKIRGRRRGHERAKDEARIYRCPLCAGGPWHLTSQPRSSGR